MTNPFSIGLLACAILAIEFCIGPYNFCQRENLLVILLLPYVLAARAARLSRLLLSNDVVLVSQQGSRFGLSRRMFL